MEMFRPVRLRLSNVRFLVPAEDTRGQRKPEQAQATNNATLAAAARSGECLIRASNLILNRNPRPRDEAKL